MSNRTDIDPAPAKSSLDRRLVVLWLIVFIDLLGFGVLIPLIPFYATRLGLSPGWVTLVISLHSLMQFAGAPLLGRLSDRYGRRPVLAISMAGHALAYVLLGFSSSIAMLVASRLLSGITAGNLSAAYAYVSDITPDYRRSEGMAKISAAFSLGYASGPLLGGLLAGAQNVYTADLARPALVAAALSALAVLAILLYLPESHTQRSSTTGIANLAEAREHRRAALRDAILIALLGLSLVVFVFGSMREALLSLWLHDQLSFSTHDIGLVFTVNGLVVALMQFFVTPRVTHRFGDSQTLLAGIVLYGISWLMLVMASNMAVVLLAISVGAAATALFGVSIQTLVSLRSKRDNRGVVMGLYQASSSLARFFGAALSGSLYAGLGPNVPFSLAAIAMLPALLLGANIRKRLARARLQADESQ